MDNSKSTCKYLQVLGEGEGEEEGEGLQVGEEEEVGVLQGEGEEGEVVGEGEDHPLRVEQLKLLLPGRRFSPSALPLEEWRKGREEEEGRVSHHHIKTIYTQAQ